MKRRLLNLLTGLSLLLCLAVCVLWARGKQRVFDVVRYDAPGRYVLVGSSHVLALITNKAPPTPNGPTRNGLQYRREISDPFILWRLLGSQDDPVGENSVLFRLGFGRWRTPGTVAVFLPHWAVALPLGVLPAWRSTRAAAGRRRRRGARHGHCATCGYDLRATPARCPECGNMAPVSPPR